MACRGKVLQRVCQTREPYDFGTFDSLAAYCVGGWTQAGWSPRGHRDTAPAIALRDQKCEEGWVSLTRVETNVCVGLSAALRGGQEPHRRVVRRAQQHRAMQAGVVMRGFLVLLFLSLSGPHASAESVSLPSWLTERAKDAAWLTETGENPRAIIELWPNGVEVVLYLPGLTPSEVVERIERYDIWTNTDMVESALCADGAFFTGTRVSMAGLSSFSPSVTAYRKDVHADSFSMSWTLLGEEAANAWLERNRSAFTAMLTTAGVDRNVEEYLEEVRGKLGGLASVEGGHTYERGFYRYKQEVHSASRLEESLVRSFGAGPQLRAALKSALFSAGRVDLAGKAGEKGVLFDVRGASKSTVRPGT